MLSAGKVSERKKKQLFSKNTQPNACFGYSIGEGAVKDRSIVNNWLS